MENRQNSDTLGFRTKEHRIWKAAHTNAADIAEHQGKAFWSFRRNTDGTIDFGDKLGA
jgi:hypothetical protein